MSCQLSFVELRVRDWARSVAWYTDLLALTPLLQNQADRFALLQSGSMRLALKEGAVLPPGEVVLLAFEVNDLAEWRDRLESRGVVFEGTLKESHEGYSRLRLRDPDGYAITLFEWRTGKNSETGLDKSVKNG